MLGVKNPDITKETILEAAARTIHRTGFGATSVADILEETGLTKGALYHHFPNKKTLGLAVVQSIREKVKEFWLVPLERTLDPLGALQDTIHRVVAVMGPEEVTLGCPLNNLAQEMSAVDKEFRREVGLTYTMWCDGFAEALARGKEAGTVASDVSPAATAAFIVAALTGCRGLAKSTRDAGILKSCGDSLIRYLDSLRPGAGSPLRRRPRAARKRVS